MACTILVAPAAGSFPPAPETGVYMLVSQPVSCYLSAQMGLPQDLQVHTNTSLRRCIPRRFGVTRGHQLPRLLQQIWSRVSITETQCDTRHIFSLSILLHPRIPLRPLDNLHLMFFSPSQRPIKHPCPPSYYSHTQFSISFEDSKIFSSHSQPFFPFYLRVRRNLQPTQLIL